MSRLAKLIGRLRASRTGVAATEMALTLPFLLTAGLWAVELANYAVTTMKVSQLAAHIADNASRIGDESMLEDRKIYESDINDLMLGANLQAGNRLDIFNRGRAIISSVEIDPASASETQYIHWQRCMGTKRSNSSYGDEGDRLAVGMGPPGEEVYAFNGEAVIFVELIYDYKPLISSRFVGSPTIDAIASFTVRTDRDLGQIYQRDNAAPDTVATCARYTNDFT